MPIVYNINKAPRHIKEWAKSRRSDCCGGGICEWCMRKFSDILDLEVHHIEEKGMGGRKGADTKENLIAVCRHCHDLAHQSLISKADLKARVELILNVVEEMHNGTTGKS